MAFEKRVLDQVRKVMNKSETATWGAEFKFGTMFVECTARDAAKIETKLNDYLNCGIIVSRVGDEFAFDFV